MGSLWPPGKALRVSTYRLPSAAIYATVGPTYHYFNKSITPRLSQSARHKDAPIISPPSLARFAGVRSPVRLKIRSGSSDIQGINRISRAICER